MRVYTESEKSECAPLLLSYFSDLPCREARIRIRIVPAKRRWIPRSAVTTTTTSFRPPSSTWQPPPQCRPTCHLWVRDRDPIGVKALFFEPKTESSRGKWLQFRASVWPERVIHQTEAKNDQYWAKISQIHTMFLIRLSV